MTHNLYKITERLNFHSPLVYNGPIAREPLSVASRSRLACPQQTGPSIPGRPCHETTLASLTGRAGRTGATFTLLRCAIGAFAPPVVRPRPPPSGVRQLAVDEIHRCPDGFAMACSRRRATGSSDLATSTAVDRRRRGAHDDRGPTHHVPIGTTPRHREPTARASLQSPAILDWKDPSPHRRGRTSDTGANNT